MDRYSMGHWWRENITRWSWPTGGSAWYLLDYLDTFGPRNTSELSRTFLAWNRSKIAGMLQVLVDMELVKMEKVGAAKVYSIKRREWKWSSAWS